MNNEINNNSNINESGNSAAPDAGTDAAQTASDEQQAAVLNASESAMLARIEKYRNEFHITNRRRIRAGIRCLLIVPLIFLILLLMTGSDRIIFLVLWVISMFLISGYLIYVEYMDFKVDKMAADVTGRSFEEMHAVTAAAARDSSSKKDKELDREIKKSEEHTEDDNDEKHF